MLGKEKISSSTSFEYLFSPSWGINKELEKAKFERYIRIIVDHVKGAVFIGSEGILPSNIEEGYILRRIIRRAIRYGTLLNLPQNYIRYFLQTTC